ncbi:hypothetical protein CC1G_08009 [Coprinopsis cinerea okayama7|uniref:F-box domain-containing protein n=1 Tax=Coprinopsis cinerea (strain Okayama-7 / 130 / ATCC MYA-4618 / FGSC 9003) TaxID=240176 RepID=A8NQ90_COPC7|nr:hypothetical protein CC1G_08009 [Coprinopsis cinerea okayama7\|eukprot:XP_001835500.2 hypothetical protein CC1G_08009 [Coprinopsis cinerea okayama7\
MHVCRHWRDVALNQAELWTFISDHRADRIGVLLEWSKSAPLDISLQCRPSKSSKNRITPAIESLIRQTLADRTILSLEMRASFTTLVGRVERMPPAAPMLHTLDLSNDTQPDGNTVMLLPDVFEEGAPLLRKVSLVHCHLPWTSSLFETLTSLRMIDRTASPPPSASLFLDIVEKMHGLVELALDVPIPDLDDQATSDRLVALRHLRTLYIGGSLKECHDILQHMVIPQSAEINFEINDEGVLHESLSLVPRRLVESPPSQNGNAPVRYTETTPQSLKITNGDGGMFTDDSLHLSVWTGNHDIPSYLARGRYYYDVWGPNFAIPAIRSLPAWSIRFLTISGYPHEHVALSEVLRVLVAVEDVFVSELDASVLVTTLLYHDPGVRNPMEPRPVEYLPALKNLSFETVVIADTEECPGILKRHPRPVELDELYQMLDGRSASGARMEKLEFIHAYNLTQDVVAVLEEVVNEVVWNGVEESFTCDAANRGARCPCRQ